MGPILLKHVVEEINVLLKDGVISKVHQPDARDIVLKVFSRGSSMPFLISVHPFLPRLHLMKEGFQNPPAPPRFCAFLRSRIIGARFIGAVQPEGERIVRIGLKKGYGPDEEGFTLVAELTGKSGNIILCDSNGVVLDSLRRFPPESSVRAVEPGLRLDPLPPFTGEAVEEEVERLSGESWNEATQRHYSCLVAGDAGDTLRRGLKKTVLKAEKKAKRKLENLRGDMTSAEGDLSFYRFGELLASNLGKAKRGATSLEATDYTRVPPETVSVALDPKLSPRENMERYFKKARKARVALGLLKDRIPDVREELEYIGSLSFALDEAQGLEDLQAIERELMEGGYIKEVKETEKEKIVRAEPVRRFVSSEGFEVLCGKSGAGNDLIVKKLAGKEDIWFHASKVPGSHVLIKVAGRGKELTKKTVEEAASLAAYHSKARAASKVEVIYTEAKHVRKPPGAKPGMVTVSGFKSIVVRPVEMEAGQ